MCVDPLVATVVGWLVNIQILQRLYSLQNWGVNPGYFLVLQVSAFLVQAELGTSTIQGTSFMYSWCLSTAMANLHGEDEPWTREREDDRLREGLSC